MSDGTKLCSGFGVVRVFLFNVASCDKNGEERGQGGQISKPPLPGDRREQRASLEYECANPGDGRDDPEQEENLPGRSGEDAMTWKVSEKARTDGEEAQAVRERQGRIGEKPGGSQLLWKSSSRKHCRGKMTCPRSCVAQCFAVLSFSFVISSLCALLRAVYHLLSLLCCLLSSFSLPSSLLPPLNNPLSFPLSSKTPWAVATTVYIAGIHDPGYFESLVDGWDEGWGLECLTAGEIARILGEN